MSNLDPSNQPVILRRIYHAQYPCPACKCREHEVSVRSHSRGNAFIYRKCANVTCATVYRVPLLALEVENPDGTTRLEKPA